MKTDNFIICDPSFFIELYKKKLNEGKVVNRDGSICINDEIPEVVNCFYDKRKEKYFCSMRDSSYRFVHISATKEEYEKSSS